MIARHHEGRWTKLVFNLNPATPTKQKGYRKQEKTSEKIGSRHQRILTTKQNHQNQQRTHERHHSAHHTAQDGPKRDSMQSSVVSRRLRQPTRPTTPSSRQRQPNKPDQTKRTIADFDESDADKDDGKDDDETPALARAGGRYALSLPAMTRKWWQWRTWVRFARVPGRRDRETQLLRWKRVGVHFTVLFQAVCLRFFFVSMSHACFDAYRSGHSC